jgi:hypothetical protein
VALVEKQPVSAPAVAPAEQAAPRPTAVPPPEELPRPSLYARLKESLAGLRRKVFGK